MTNQELKEAGGSYVLNNPQQERMAQLQKERDADIPALIKQPNHVVVGEVNAGNRSVITSGSGRQDPANQQSSGQSGNPTDHYVVINGEIWIEKIPVISRKYGLTM